MLFLLMPALTRASQDCPRIVSNIKQLTGANRLHVESDHPAVDGLVFDAQGLDPLIDEARKTCRW